MGSKTWHNEPVYKTELWTKKENKLVVAKRVGDRGRIEWETGVSRCKLLHIERINKFLLLSTENYIQYSMISHNRKECICKTKSSCCTPVINTAL